MNERDGKSEMSLERYCDGKVKLMGKLKGRIEHENESMSSN